MFHLALLALDVEWYGEWVPSDANLADIMTRPIRFWELERGLGLGPAVQLEHADVRSRLIERTLVLPPLGAHWDDLEAWYQDVRSH